MMPELKVTPMGEIGGNMLQRQFFQMLPTDFTKQDAITQAEVLGVAETTMKRWLTKYVQTSDIERIGHGLYKKKGAYIVCAKCENCAIHCPINLTFSHFSHFAHIPLICYIVHPPPFLVGGLEGGLPIPYLYYDITM